MTEQQTRFGQPQQWAPRCGPLCIHTAALDGYPTGSGYAVVESCKWGAEPDSEYCAKHRRDGG